MFKRRKDSTDASSAQPSGQQQIVVKQKGPGCLKYALSFGCGVPMAFCGGLILVALVIAYLVNQGEEAATKDAIERNNGRGIIEQPIASGEWAKFEDGQLRSTRLIRPADEMIEDFNTFNDESPEGADYVLVWFEVKCEADRCQPSVDLKLRLVDDAGKEWSEPLFIVLREDLDSQEAVRNGSMAGWQVFEFPSGEDIQSIWMKWDTETLYQIPPTPESS